MSAKLYALHQNVSPSSSFFLASPRLAFARHNNSLVFSPVFYSHCINIGILVVFYTRTRLPVSPEERSPSLYRRRRTRRRREILSLAGWGSVTQASAKNRGAHFLCFFILANIHSVFIIKQQCCMKVKHVLIFNQGTWVNQRNACAPPLCQCNRGSCEFAFSLSPSQYYISC